MSDAWPEPPRTMSVPVDRGSVPPAPLPPAFAGMPPATDEPVLVTVGDIACTPHWVITPNGTLPIAGSTWTVSNQTTTTERIPAYAIVLAIIFFLFCLLGLLFLLIKERTMHGYVTVTVQSPAGYHATQVPVASVAQVADTEARVHYIRSLVAAARA